MFFKNYNEFKNYFNNIFKKYHPDNKETGNAELFIKYKKTYDDAIKSGIVKKIIHNEEIEITTTQAYNGCVVNCHTFDIKIPQKFYNKKQKIEVIDKNNILHKIYVKIIPEKDEIITYDKKFADLIITKIISLNIFDIILGCEKSFLIFGEKIKIKIKPYEIFKNPIKKLDGLGYPQRYNITKRNPLYLQFKLDKIDFTNKDIKYIKELRDKYEKI